MPDYPKHELQIKIEQIPEWQKAQRGELYRAFIPELVAVRDRCATLCDQFNVATDRSRRNMVKMWREISLNPLPLPPPAAIQSEDDALFDSDPWVMAPVHADYGFNIHVETGAFVNYNATFVDTFPIRIGARTLLGPNCSLYSGSHPIDPAVRNGLEGPESGAPINIEPDCWLGGNVIVLPGVTIGRGSTVGAGSVVTRDVPPFHVVAGNPARILRKIETAMDTSKEANPTSTVAKQ